MVSAASSATETSVRFTSDQLADPVELTRAMVDIPSVSGTERELADAVEAALRTRSDLRVERDGNVVLARTELGRAQRVVLAGHLAPLGAPFAARVAAELGRGLPEDEPPVSASSLGGDAVALAAAGTVTRRLVEDPARWLAS